MGGESEDCQWQSGNESSDENYVFNREVRGSRDVTKSLPTDLYLLFSASLTLSY